MCSTTKLQKHKQGRWTRGNSSVISFYNRVTVLMPKLAAGRKLGEPDLVLCNDPYSNKHKKVLAC